MNSDALTDAERDDFMMQCARNASATIDPILEESGLARGTHAWCKASHFEVIISGGGLPSERVGGMPPVVDGVCAECGETI